MERTTCKVRYLTPLDESAWDAYVYKHPASTLYHLSGWRKVIEKSYGHRTFYLMAEAVDAPDRSTGPEAPQRLVGLLPLVHLKHFLFGNSLVSMPFLDYGGVLADNEDAQKALLLEALRIGRELRADHIELRHIQPLVRTGNPREDGSPVIATRSHKVRMLLDLPGSFDDLMRSFKSKLRSQINRPLKGGLDARIGHSEFLEEFYEVFATNMRDLGSPVHSRNLMQNVLSEFGRDTRVCLVLKDKQPVAASLVIGFRETLENPWASSLRRFKHLSPNMLLYRTMLEYACNSGFKEFDFGRSSPDEGTFKFKSQWGCNCIPLHWHYLSLRGETAGKTRTVKSRYMGLINLWQQIPVCVTRIIGPPIRKYIPL